MVGRRWLRHGVRLAVAAVVSVRRRPFSLRPAPAVLTRTCLLSHRRELGLPSPARGARRAAAWHRPGGSQRPVQAYGCDPDLGPAEASQRQTRRARGAGGLDTIGPNSVFNGQGLDGTSVTVSGRVTAIAVDPTNSKQGLSRDGLRRGVALVGWRPDVDGHLRRRRVPLDRRARRGSIEPVDAVRRHR